MNRITRITAAAGAALVIFGLSVVVDTSARAFAAEIFIRPIRGATSLGFGAKYKDADGRIRRHHGIDINADEGTAVTASAYGKVFFAGSTPNGSCVSIIHSGAIKTTYLPLSGIKVGRGDTVQAGQIIGYIGAAADPSAKTSHLHMGAIFAGEYIDPESLFRGEFKPDLSKVIRRGDIPPTGNPNPSVVLSPAAVVAIEMPGFFSWLWDQTASVFEWLISGASNFLTTLGTACVNAWSWMMSIASNTGSFLWGKLVLFGTGIFKWISGSFGLPLKIAIGDGNPGEPYSSFGIGAGVQVFDPSGDVSEPGNRVSIQLDSFPARVEVFDAKGKSVWTLDAWDRDGGRIYWTGVDSEGRIVSPGLYTVIVEYADRTEGFLVEARWHS